MPSLRSVNDSEQIEGSPLLSKAQGVESNPSSTVHADRFDMSRFSERKDNEEESSLRIILYVVVVIVIGVGLALLVRSLISNESEPTDTENQVDNEQPEDLTPEPIESANLSISTTMKNDPLDTPSNEELIDSLSLSVGNTNASVDNISISKFTYNRYNTFARVEFEIDGVTLQEELPRIAINYNADRNSLDVVFPSEMQINENLMETIQINDLVTNSVYGANTNTFTLNVSTEFRYLVTPTTQGITIDIRSLDQVEGRLDEEEPEETPDTEEAPDDVTEDTVDEEPQEEPESDNRGGTSTPPSGVRLDNEFSRDKQFVSGGVTGNTITLNETFYEDQGDFFEIAWGEPRVVGEEFTPYASAELVTEEGLPYIKLTIENLERIEFNENGVSQADLSIDLIAANFVRADLESFENGRAEIMIQLKNEADFRLISTETVSGLTQVLALQIRD